MGLPRHRPRRELDDYRISLDGVSGEFTYLVRVEPAEQGWWLLLVPEINHATQARFLGEADMMARDLIAVMTGQVATTSNSPGTSPKPSASPTVTRLARRKSTTSPTGCPSSTGPARRSASNSSRPISRTTDGAITQSRHSHCLGERGIPSTPPARAERAAWKRRPRPSGGGVARGTAISGSSVTGARRSWMDMGIRADSFWSAVTKCRGAMLVLGRRVRETCRCPES